MEPTLDQLSPQYQATWHPLSQIPYLDLVYDHPIMLLKAIDQLRLRIRLQPIGFELLPEKFTMTKLRQLYESILARPLDKRNFTKKVSAMNLLQKLEEKQKDREGDKAAEDVNVVRRRAGIPVITATTLTEEDIHVERMPELAFEDDRLYYL